MKKLISFMCLCLVMAMAISFSSCTENQRAKHWGGSMTINVKSGYKVTMATFKENDMWYMVEPMDEDYVPKDKMLIEDSNWGMIEGKVTFHETRAENVAQAVLDSIPNTKAIKVEFEHRQ